MSGRDEAVGSSNGERTIHVVFNAPVSQSVIGGERHTQIALGNSSGEPTVLYPVGLIPLADERHLDWAQNTWPLQVRKAGSGLVDSVCAAFLPPRSPWPRGLSELFSLWRSPLFAPQEIERTVTMERGGIMLFTSMTIGSHSPWAPPVPSYPDMVRGQPYIVGRLTLTYHDLSGSKYASIFDYYSGQGWQRVAFLAAIPADLIDLDLQARSPSR